MKKKCHKQRRVQKTNFNFPTFYLNKLYLHFASFLHLLISFITSSFLNNLISQLLFSFLLPEKSLRTSNLMLCVLMLYSCIPAGMKICVGRKGKQAILGYNILRHIFIVVIYSKFLLQRKRKGKELR
jgi:hypothetical protein